MESSNKPIPKFRDDGYLPDGLYIASLADVCSRFGVGNRQRRRLTFRLIRWVELALAVNAKRLFVDGSFVTAKEHPGDVDAVVQLPNDFRDQLNNGSDVAIELEEMLLTRQPQEIFAAEDDRDWDDWLEFFSRTREADHRRKGLIEVQL